MTIPRTKTDQLRQALAEGRDIDALRIAKSFRMLGQFKAEIQRAWDAYQNPRFAKSLGRNPEDLVRAGIDAIRTLYPN